MRQPVHKYLEEFASDGPEGGEPVVLPLRRRQNVPSVEAAPDADRLNNVYATGYQEGISVGRAQVETELAALVADCQQRLEECKQLFADSVANALTVELNRNLDRIHSTIEDRVGAVLVPTLKHIVTESAIREFSSALRTLARDGNAMTVELSGPEELVERVWRRYCELEHSQQPGTPHVVRFHAGATPEVRATVNDTVIESRLAEWIARINEAAG